LIFIDTDCVLSLDNIDGIYIELFHLSISGLWRIENKIISYFINA